MLDAVLRGLIKTHAQAEDVHVPEEMTNKMFMDNEDYGFGLDLVAQIIQQGRDHGLPGYKDWRKFCGLPEVRTFDDLRDVMSPSSVGVIRNAYSSIQVKLILQIFKYTQYFGQHTLFTKQMIKTLYYRLFITLILKTF